jgi:hypothetical protein
LHPIQQKFFEFLGTQNCMHIFTFNPISLFHSPAGRPAVIFNRLEVLPILLYRLWAGIDPACRLPSWVVISCRRPVPLQEGNNNPWDAQRDQRHGVQGLLDQQDPRMAPALGTRRACSAPPSPGAGAGVAGAATPARPPKMQV